MKQAPHFEKAVQSGRMTAWMGKDHPINRVQALEAHLVEFEGDGKLKRISIHYGDYALGGPLDISSYNTAYTCCQTPINLKSSLQETMTECDPRERETVAEKAAHYRIGLRSWHHLFAEHRMQNTMVAPL